MARSHRYFSLFSAFHYVIGFSLIAVMASVAAVPTAQSYMMLVALVPLAAIAVASPAPVRSFWTRLSARSRDPVPRTT